MKKILIVGLVISSLLLASCGNEESNSDKQSKNKVSTNTSIKWRSCLESYNYDLDKILTKEDALKYFDASNHGLVETEFKKRENSLGAVKYSYKNGRNFTITAGNSSHDVPDFDFISLTGLEFSTLNETKVIELFNRKYKKLSDEEFNELKANMEKQFEGKPKELENAIKLLEVRKRFNTTSIDNLGTAAYWKSTKVSGNYNGGELYVLAGTVEFSIHSKVGESDDKNCQFAIDIAKNILEKCN